MLKHTPYEEQPQHSPSSAPAYIELLLANNPCDPDYLHRLFPRRVTIVYLTRLGNPLLSPSEPRSSAIDSNRLAVCAARDSTAQMRCGNDLKQSRSERRSARCSNPTRTSAPVDHQIREGWGAIRPRDFPGCAEGGIRESRHTDLASFPPSKSGTRARREGLSLSASHRICAYRVQFANQIHLVVREWVQGKRNRLGQLYLRTEVESLGGRGTK